MHENRNFAVPVNIITLFARTPFSWAMIRVSQLHIFCVVAFAVNFNPILLSPLGSAFYDG